VTRPCAHIPDFQGLYDCIQAGRYLLMFTFHLGSQLFLVTALGQERPYVVVFSAVVMMQKLDQPVDVPRDRARSVTPLLFGCDTGDNVWQ
jgi:hypothetical protein